VTPIQRVEHALDLLVGRTDLEDPIEVSVSLDVLISALSRAFPKAGARHRSRSALPSVLESMAATYGLDRSVIPVAQRINDTTRINAYFGTLSRSVVQRLSDDLREVDRVLRQFLKRQEAG